MSAIELSTSGPVASMKVSMLDEWTQLHKVIYHKEVPKVQVDPKSVFDTTACFRCGVCVCGRGEASKPDVGFALGKLIASLKKFMWKKKQKMARSRALLEAGHVVLVLKGSLPASVCRVPSGPSPSPSGSGPGPKPKDSNQEGHCIFAGECELLPVTQLLFFHPGQVNFKTWNFALTRLTKVKDPNEFGYLELEAACSAESDHGVMTIPEFLASDAVALDSSFHIAAHQIVSDQKLLLSEDRMLPQILELHQEPLFEELFWDGSEEEKKHRAAAARKKRPAQERGPCQRKRPRVDAKRKPRPKQPRAADEPAEAPSAAEDGDLAMPLVNMHESREGEVAAEEDALDLLGALLKADRVDEAADNLDNFDLDSDHHSKESDAPHGADDARSNLSATDESQAALDSADDREDEKVRNLEFYLESDIPGPGGQANPASPAHSRGYSPSIAPSEEVFGASGDEAAAAACGDDTGAAEQILQLDLGPGQLCGEAAAPPPHEPAAVPVDVEPPPVPASYHQRSAGPTGPREAKPIGEAKATTTATRRAAISELSVDVAPFGSIRYNLSDNFFRAICHCEGHEHCQRKRTAAAGRHPGQGRPLGALVAWLQSADKYPSRKEHIEAPPAPLEDRREGREFFKYIDDEEELVCLERDKRDGEPDEPDSVP